MRIRSVIRKKDRAEAIPEYRELAREAEVDGMVITEKTYVEQAEVAIKKHKARKNLRNGRPLPMVTTSKIRNLLAMTTDLYHEVLNSKQEEMCDELKGRVDYLKVRFVYEAGREPSVRNFVEDADILSCIQEIGNSRKQYLLFSHYMEALVAYHKFYGGRES
ncbi:type III-A CRISPR-associated protein Csm2 [Lachnospiraceae bacterium 29-84]